jgi:hypothetical protein
MQNVREKRIDDLNGPDGEAEGGGVQSCTYFHPLVMPDESERFGREKSRFASNSWSKNRSGNSHIRRWFVDFLKRGRNVKRIALNGLDSS